MRIGIDISQITYENTGVAKFLEKLVEQLAQIDQKNEYILFFSSTRRKTPSFVNKLTKDKPNFRIKNYRFPPSLLDLIWNRLHILPIEWLIGPIDIFISSDWTQPPIQRAKRATILYDLIVYKYPEETAGKIVAVQKRRLKWVSKECEVIFCISESTKKDAKELLDIDERRLKIIYPGV